MTSLSRLVVLISGNGSNLQAILDACASGELPASVVSVISNKAEAYGLTRAGNAGVEAIYFPKQENESRRDYDTRLADEVTSKQAEYIILAGWMRILTSSFLDHFPNRVINLHPALPDTFPGTHAIERAFEAYQRGEIGHTGVMVHLVPDEGVDNGPVLATEIVPILSTDTLESLEAHVHEVEHKILINTLKTILDNSMIIGKLVWSQYGDVYRANILDMQASVKSVGSRFKASLVDNSGSILREIYEEFDDIYSAEEWALFVAIEIEQSGNQEIAMQKMLKALDEATHSIQDHVHHSHIERLTRMRNWFLSRHAEIESLRTLNKELLQTLEWKQIDAKTFSTITPHGKAVIFEKGITAHEAWIEHDSGAKYEALETFIDFLDAEYWLQKELNHLNDPHINEVNLNCIHFTMEICRRLSLHSADVLNIARLEYLEMLLNEALP
jgi:phosphoribosylglycinamide formyltransferase-1